MALLFSFLAVLTELRHFFFSARGPYAGFTDVERWLHFKYMQPALKVLILLGMLQGRVLPTKANHIWGLYWDN